MNNRKERIKSILLGSSQKELATKDIVLEYKIEGKGLSNSIYEKVFTEIREVEFSPKKYFSFHQKTQTIKKMYFRLGILIFLVSMLFFLKDDFNFGFVFFGTMLSFFAIVISYEVGLTDYQKNEYDFYYDHMKTRISELESEEEQGRIKKQEEIKEIESIVNEKKNVIQF
ncbi:hypothetical protein [Exiguobacterium antarcticum]|uniref:hypothetical protein n=1 Tax=Exiguobacterium antarcticum TaxID=132920 RepID=UPI00047D7F3C|nr:hypothetical protein [Exiguobacterium antarcticum]